MQLGEDKQNTWLIAGLVGCIGCGALLVGLFGLFIFGWTLIPSTPPASPVVSAPPVVSPVTAPHIPAPPPPGWVTYTHPARCSRNPELRLEHFSVAHPSAWAVLPCERQQPTPFGYVNFNQQTAEGVLVAQATLSYARIAQLSMLQQAADQLIQQLNATASTEVDSSPLMARGLALLRRDATFRVPQDLGGFRTGEYVIRQVVIPNPVDVEGLSITYIAPAFQGGPTALATSLPDLVHFVESVRF